MAQRIALEYVRGNEGDLNRGIAKVAEERELSRLHIQSLVTAVNHATNDLLRKQADDKTFSFGVANIDEVLNLLANTPTAGIAVTKVAEVFKPSLSADFSKNLTKVANAVHDPRAILDKKLAGQYIDEIAGYIKTAARTLEAERVSELAKLAETLDTLAVRVGDYLRNKTPLQDIHRFTSAVADSPQFADAVIHKVAELLEKKGHPFTGIMAAASELGKENHERTGVPVPSVKVSVINGDAPITKTVRDVKRAMSTLTETEAFLHELSSLSENVEIARHSLKDNADVTRYIANELGTVCKNLRNDKEVAMDKRAFVVPLLNAARGSRILGGAFREGLRVTNRVSRGLTGKSLARHATRVVPAMGAAAAVSKGLSTTQHVADRLRKGLSGSSGVGAADSSNVYLK